jgi:hypothetical protein
VDNENVIHTHTHTHTIEYYLAIKNNEILSFSGKWMEPTTIMLSTVNQTEKDKYCMFSFMGSINLNNDNNNNNNT